MNTPAKQTVVSQIYADQPEDSSEVKRAKAVIRSEVELTDTRLFAHLKDVIDDRSDWLAHIACLRDALEDLLHTDLNHYQKRCEQIESLRGYYDETNKMLKDRN